MNAEMRQSIENLSNLVLSCLSHAVLELRRLRNNAAVTFHGAHTVLKSAFQELREEWDHAVLSGGALTDELKTALKDTCVTVKKAVDIACVAAARSKAMRVNRSLMGIVNNGNDLHTLLQMVLHPDQGAAPSTAPTKPHPPTEF